MVAPAVRAATRSAVRPVMAALLVLAVTAVTVLMASRRVRLEDASVVTAGTLVWKGLRVAA